MSDRILGGLGLALSIFFIWAATTIPESFMTDAIGPKTFPIIIGVILGLSSLVFLWKPDPEPHWPDLGRLAEIGFAVVVTFLYAVFLPQLGFLVATTLAASYLGWRLGTPPLQAILVGVGTAIGIYVVFKLVLGLSLAEGPLGF